MNYGPETCAAAARPMTPVEAAASDCDGAQHRLTATIDQLAERLSMVLAAPAAKVEANSGAPEPAPSSLLVSFLRENHNRTHSHIRRLEDLLDRLTI